MKKELLYTKEETLDPVDWDEVTVLGKTMVEDMVAYLKEVADKPVWKKPPPEVTNSFSASLPQIPMPLGKVYEEFKETILPYSIGNTHPRFWSWVMGSGSVQGMLAELLAAGLNSNVGIGDQSPMYVDTQVVNWCKQIIQYPAQSSGILVNGASAANLNALIVARNAVNKYIRSRGIQIYSNKLVMYASTETHSCIQKAAEIIGIGSDGVRKIRVNDQFQMDMEHLEEMIRKDQANGDIPFCVVANVGTVNTGAIDPLEEIFMLCMKHNLWFHIDGAFGALAKLLPEYSDQLSCIELADSVAFDLHKWMYIPYEAAVVLVKDANRHRQTFALQPSYIANQEKGIAGGPELNSNFGFDLSRNFKALKIWMALKENGIDKYTRLIRQNILQARYLEKGIAESSLLQLMAPVSLNIICFRYNPGGMEPWELNLLNKEIVMYLQESGIAAPSYCTLNHLYCIRVAITNHRSVKEDFDLLIHEVCLAGAILQQKYLSEKSSKKAARSILF